MTFQALYNLELRGALDCRIVGVARDEWSADELHQHARDSIDATVESPDSAAFERLMGRMAYVSGDYAEEDTYERLAAEIKDATLPVFYLEIPPSLFGVV